MIREMVYPPFEFVKAQLASNLTPSLFIDNSTDLCFQASDTTPPPSFVGDLLSWPENLYSDREKFEEAVTWVAAVMYGGESSHVRGHLQGSRLIPHFCVSGG